MKDEAAMTSRGSGGSSFRLPPSSLLAYSLFLACSWTWVIGMYLPVILVRDFGPLAWAAFAAPNILGAAAMGWVLRSADESGQFLLRHRPAVRTFSLVTIAFHAFFLAWFLPRLIGTWALAGVGGLVAAALGARLVGGGESRGTPDITPPRVWAAAGVFALSLAAFAYLLAAGPTPGLSRAVDWPDFGGLTLALVFGFALCPYLDVTFHEARQATGARGGLAFGLGFGGFFLVMLLFTLAYSSAILTAAPLGALAWVLAGHLTLQSLYTVWVHVRGLTSTAGPATSPGRGGGTAVAVGLTAACVLGILAATVAVQLERAGYRLAGLGAGEVVYRSFMGFYGLVFPAYVWLCAAGMRRDRPPAARVGAFAVVVLMGVPLYALAFLWRREAWAGLAMLVIVAGKVLATLAETPPASDEGQQAGT